MEKVMIHLIKINKKSANPTLPDPLALVSQQLTG